MSGIAEKILAWLTPARRKAIQGVVLSAVAVAAILGYGTSETWQPWVALGTQVAAFLVVVLSAVAARRADMTALYAGFAAVIAALVTVGWVTDAQASMTLNLAQQAVIVLPLLLAFVRTDTSTATGEPAPEVAAPVTTEAPVTSGPEATVTIVPTTTEG